MMGSPDISYRRFSRAEWSALGSGEAMTLTRDDVERLRGLGDPISLEEAESTYLPLSRLLSLRIAAVAELHAVTRRFLGERGEKVPFIIGIAGSVAVGKSTTARILTALLQRWPSSPRVDLVTTDGFLLPNAVLAERGLMRRKGFPESYDRGRLVAFLADVKSGRRRVAAPLYSHLVYDVLDGEEIVVDQPNVLIVEGLNILQPGGVTKRGEPQLFASDFIDFSIYVDADTDVLGEWYMERFFRLRETAFRNPDSFFRRYAEMSREDAGRFGQDNWRAINLPNLMDNILPTRSRADLVLRKARNHELESVHLRRR
jgi:type I pantothenate kinase